MYSVDICYPVVLILIVGHIDQQDLVLAAQSRKPDLAELMTHQPQAALRPCSSKIAALLVYLCLSLTCRI